MPFWRRRSQVEKDQELRDKGQPEAKGESVSAPGTSESCEADSESQPNDRAPAEKPKKGILARFREKLKSTHRSIMEKAEGLFRRAGKIDDDLLEELEEILIAADVGVDASVDMIEKLRERVRVEGKKNSSDLAWLRKTLEELVREEIGDADRALKWAEGRPTIWLVVGVNGTGKTTLIGKLAHRFVKEGKKVLVCAADTFRAAAIGQLRIWTERANCDLIATKEGGDPAAAVFDALKAARSRQVDVVIIDTAGRLHTKKNLMQELGKIGRIVEREFPGAPDETLLVIDASTGQNGLSQAKLFVEAVRVTGVALTKLDGTAKGGVTIGIHTSLGIPVKLVGLGETLEDLEEFNPEAFVQAIFE